MFKTVSPEVKKHRLETCWACDQFNLRWKTCNQCGCYMPAKAMFAKFKCPLERWGESEPGTDLINKIEEAILDSWNKQ